MFQNVMHKMCVLKYKDERRRRKMNGIWWCFVMCVFRFHVMMFQGSHSYNTFSPKSYTYLGTNLNKKNN
jgi:hypothetical protein